MTLYTHAFPPDDLRNSVLQALPGIGQEWESLKGGRVNRLWRAGGTVVKLFQPNGESPLFPNDQQAETRALGVLAPSGIAPTLCAHGPGWLAYRHVPGQIWAKDPRLVADVLTRLHRLPPPAALPFRNSANGSAALIDQAKTISALCKATLPPVPAPIVPPGQTCLIHGDAVPGNMIAAEGRITLIDWQCPAIGDPAEDLATFLSPAMQWLYRGRILAADEVSAFLDACPAATVGRYLHLKKLFHWRMAAHCLWKSEQGDTDYAVALSLELAAF